MKIFHADFKEKWSRGGYETADYIITANSESEALGLALEARCDSLAHHWTISEIDASKVSIECISSYSN